MKRRALFVGVNRYDDPQIRDLDYSRSDANSLRTIFGLFGYETDILEDPTKSDVFQAVRKMTRDLAEGDLFFFYFAGHGWTTTSGKHLLFCTDDLYEDLRDDDAGISFDKLKRKTAGGYDRAFVLDACRSDFLTGTRGADETTRDLRPVGELVRDAPAKGALAVLRSCSQYEHALEIASRKHGLFTLAMLRVLDVSSGAELLFNEPLCDAVTEKMREIAAEEGVAAGQTPEFAKSGIAPVLVAGRKASAGPQPAYFACPECGGYNLITDTFKCKVCGRDHLCKSHRDESANYCSSCVAKSRPSPSSLPSHVSQLSRPSHTPGEAMSLTLPGGTEMCFRWCPAGTFWMGSENGEEGRSDDETYHRVTLTKGFWMGETPVTQGQWKSVMGNNPSKFTGDDALPVESVSWDDCAEFIKKANAGLLGVRLRLPKEAEWEYACRAGTTGPYGGTGKLDEMGWYGGNSGSRTHPVGRKKPNDWGLYDMHGNVWEWCADRYGDYPKGDATDPTGPASGGSRVLRGDSWYSRARYCRSAIRSGGGPGNRDSSYGFRLCCSAGPRGQETE